MSRAGFHSVKLDGLLHELKTLYSKLAIQKDFKITIHNKLRSMIKVFSSQII